MHVNSCEFKALRLGSRLLRLMGVWCVPVHRFQVRIVPEIQPEVTPDSEPKTHSSLLQSGPRLPWHSPVMRIGCGETRGKA